MSKKRLRLLTVLLTVMLCCAALTPAAFAYADDPEPAETAEAVQETDTPEDDTPEDDFPVIGGAEPLTPEGNLTLVDDIEGEAAGDKQFIIVQTKAGNTFYIIIDRAADGENTVYFLNAVDEADLMALMEDGEPATCDCTTKCAAGAVDTACPVCAVNMTECVGPEPEPEPEPTSEPVEEPAEESSGLSPAVLLVVLLVLGGGGAFAYFKLVKGRKASTKGPNDLDDYDYGEDDEEYEDSLADDEDEDGEGKGT
ncbi:DUF4366 domain-containing protein [Pseudoflavonifractor phocaeensis]|uniref:DUF4366 domain-containing protein n=1 Tax=Pseudoflavonifractor phocaeensis TaxID=1870988 RepID=UPI001FB0397F|nr:DUF4366 domain-containing protein [Pseudoflavonifractor phocaeensis]